MEHRYNTEVQLTSEFNRLIKMYLTKLGNGHYTPSDDKSHEESQKIKVGSEIKGVKARNIKFHRKAFALLNLGFSNQDKFEQFEVYRKVMIIRAGFYDEAPIAKGVYFIPKSLSFEKMSATDFESWYEATLDILSKDLETKPEDINAEIEGFY